ncbi:MAG: rod shape-determining protein MreD [Candidatus Rokubacteria bacterium]|nr:rod shape-determining protein MreD [Candidatus Rokubacteria bacterium]MBI3031016.1 rod shape-determining protein MreD [Candidatus Rokubacteria bacterium]
MRVSLALMLLGGGLAHTSVAPALRLGAVAPDIPLILTVLLGLRRGPEVGCLSGFVVGLLQDVAGGGFVGAQALTKALAGFVAGLIGERLLVGNPLVQVPGLVLLTLAEGLGRYWLLQLLHFPAAFGEVMLHVVLPQALYNGFLGAAGVLAVSVLEAYRSGSLWR